MCDVYLQQIKLWQIDRLECDHCVLNLDDGSSHSRALALVDTDLITFHVDCLTSLHERSLENFFNSSIITVIIFVIVDHTIAETGLEVLQLFIGRLDAGTSIDLLKCKGLEHKASMEQLVSDGPHVIFFESLVLRG